MLLRGCTTISVYDNCLFENVAAPPVFKHETNLLKVKCITKFTARVNLCIIPKDPTNGWLLYRKNTTLRLDSVNESLFWNILTKQKPQNRKDFYKNCIDSAHKSMENREMKSTRFRLRLLGKQWTTLKRKHRHFTFGRNA